MAKWDNDIDKMFADSLNNLEMAPPPNVKKAVNKKLFGGKMVWLYVASIAIVLSIVGIAAYFYSASHQNEVIAKNNIVSKSTHRSVPSNESDGKQLNPHLNQTKQEIIRVKDVAKYNSDDQLIDQDNKSANNVTSSSGNQNSSTKENFNNKYKSRTKNSARSNSSKSNDLINKLSQKNSSKQSDKDNISSNSTTKNTSSDNKMKSNLLSNTELTSKTKNDENTSNDNFINENVVENQESEILFHEKLSTSGKKNELTIQRMFIDPYSNQNLTRDLKELDFTRSKFKLKPLWEVHLYGGMGTQSVSPRLNDSSQSFYRNKSSVVSEFGLNARMYLKDWHISSGLKMQMSKMQLSQEQTTTSMEQTGTTLQIDTVFVPNTDSIISIDSMIVPTYSSVTLKESNLMVYKLNTLSIPLKFGYRFRFNKFHWMLGAGVQFNIPVSSSAKVQYGEGFQTVYSSVKDSPYKSANMQLMLESEFHYKLNYHWSLSLTPSYRYQVSPVFKSKDVFVPNKHSGFLKLGVHYYF